MTATLRLLPPGPSGLLSARPEPDLAAFGYLEEEYVASGSAVSYRPVGDLDGNGRWTLEPGDPEDAAEFATRVVVRRPAPGTRFSGTVLCEWLNVSSGADAAPEWTFVADEVLRSGHAWCGISAQYVGVEGGGGSVSIGDLPPAPGLRGTDPDRYGDLHHPGDAYAHDVYTQVSAAVRDLVRAALVLAVGESQSAFCLTTYANGVQPLTGLADGFLIHSRGAAAAPLGVAGTGLRMEDVLATPPVRLRDDLEVPVLVVQTEGDLFDRIAYLPARQPDTELLRVWEIAGAAHADRYVIGEFESFLGSPVPVNRGQQWPVLRAGVRALDLWARGGEAPPSAPPIETTPDGCVLDAHGLARGGVRTPVVDVPVEVVSGRAWPGVNVGIGLFGSTTPLAGVTDLYPSVDAYLASYAAATDAMITAGFALPEDRDAILDEARPELLSTTVDTASAKETAS